MFLQSNDLSRDVLSAGLLVVHDSGRGGQHNVTELTGRKELDDPVLHIGETDVVSWGDTSSLVDASIELDDDLAGTVIINLLKLANVA